MEKPEKERKRSFNYTLREKELLISLVQKNLEILENKKTNAIFNKQKAQCWEKLAWEYNAQQNSGLRTGAQLKSTYEQMKKIAKQHMAEDKIQVKKTGGGTFIPKVTDMDEKIICLIKENYFCINNKFDSNSGMDYNEVSIQGSSRSNDLLSESHSEDMEEKITVIYTGTDDDYFQNSQEFNPERELLNYEAIKSVDVDSTLLANELENKPKGKKRKIETETLASTIKKSGAISTSKNAPITNEINNKKLEVLDLKISILRKVEESEIENLKGKKLDNEIKELMKENQIVDLKIKKLTLANLSSS